MRGALHTDENTAYLPAIWVPILYQVVNGLPATQVEIAHAKIGTVAHLHRASKGSKQVLVNIVKNSRHKALRYTNMHPIRSSIQKIAWPVRRQTENSMCVEICAESSPVLA
jgi:hypothetical protein